MAGDPKPTKMSEAIGLRIQKLCAEKYETKSDCARAFGVRPQNWKRIESGKMKFDPDELYRFAAFFGVDPGWLLTGRDPPNTAKLEAENAKLRKENAHLCEEKAHLEAMCSEMGAQKAKSC